MNLVRKVRNDKGLTLRSLAISSGLYDSTVSMVERGGRCGGSVKSKLAAALEKSVDELFPAAPSKTTLDVPAVIQPFTPPKVDDVTNG